MAVFKIFYLAIENITKKWTMPIQNWNTAIAHFMIKFEDRINLNQYLVKQRYTDYIKAS